MKFVLPGEPVPKGRPRLNKTTGTIYTPKDTVVYEESVAIMARSQRDKYGDSPVKLTALFFTSRKRGADVDNLVKSTADGLIKSGIIDDDSQIVEVHAARIRSNNPRAEVTLEPCEELSEVPA